MKNFSLIAIFIGKICKLQTSLQILCFFRFSISKVFEVEQPNLPKLTLFDFAAQLAQHQPGNEVKQTFKDVIFNCAYS